MKLFYRGTIFNYDPVNNTEQSVQPSEPYELIYRGRTYRVDPAVATTVTEPTEYELMYRGVTYQVKRNIQGELTAVTSFANPFKRKTSANSAIQNTPSEYSV